MGATRNCGRSRENRPELGSGFNPVPDPASAFITVPMLGRPPRGQNRSAHCARAGIWGRAFVQRTELGREPSSITGAHDNHAVRHHHCRTRPQAAGRGGSSSARAACPRSRLAVPTLLVRPGAGYRSSGMSFRVPLRRDPLERGSRRERAEAERTELGARGASRESKNGLANTRGRIGPRQAVRHSARTDGHVTVYHTPFPKRSMTAHIESRTNPGPSWLHWPGGGTIAQCCGQSPARVAELNQHLIFDGRAARTCHKVAADPVASG